MVEAAASLPHPPERVFAFLADLHDHWRLEDAFVELDALESDELNRPSGGRVRLKGPLGLHAEAVTTVLAADPPAPPGPGRLLGLADIGRVTVGRVGWEIVADETGGSNVRLWAKVERASLADCVLLAARGRRWLARNFRRAVGNLARVLEQDRQIAG